MAQDPTKIELSKQADLLEKVLMLAKKNYTTTVERHEKDDAEGILNKLNLSGDAS